MNRSMLSLKAQEKMDRIIQIQQQVHDLQKELETLLGDGAEQGKERKFYRRDRAGSREIREARLAAVREAVNSLASTMQQFPKGAVLALCREKGHKVSLAQVSQVIRFALKRGEIEEFGAQSKDGTVERMYRLPVGPVGFRSVRSVRS